VSDRRGLAILFLVMMVLAIAIGGIAIGTLYTEIDAQRAGLREAVRLQASLAQHDPAALQTGSAPRPIEQTTQIYRMLGPGGMLGIGRLDGRTVVYLDNPWLPDVRPPPPAPIASDQERPMRRALAGEEGTTLTVDERGELVIAAFSPIPGTDLGIVARTSMSLFRGPFVHSAAVVGGIVLALFVVGASMFFAVGKPVMRRIREGEHRFRELFENMRSGAAVYRATNGADDFVLTGFNRGAERIEGVARQEVLGRLLSDVFPAIRHGRLFEVLRRVWRTGQPEHVSTSCCEDERITGWRENYVYKLPSGEIVVLYEDVTDRKRAEEALKESEGRWRSIIEAYAQAIVIVDQQHEIRFVNKAAEALFGRTAQELIGTPFGFPLVQGDVAEIEIIRPGRSIAYGEMRAIPMRWSGQANFLLFIQDVSAHKRAEGDLRKLFQAIEQSPASVMITDVDGRIEYVNPKFMETTGYTYAEVVGKTPGFLRSGYTSTREYQDLWKTIGAGQVWRGEFHNRRKNGELFWELASIAPVRDGRGKVTHYVAVKEDISELKATEERLRHSQRMEMIGQLTGGIAHDFNNLLAIILGNLQLLEEKRDLDAESRELIADAVWSAERGAQLTHRLLAFARRQWLNPKLTDINHVVEEMTGLLRRTLGERIEIREDLAHDVGETMIDRGQLENALLNLVVNARDAMPNGGVLTISTGTAVLPRDLQTPGEDVVPGEYVALTVADSGTGMPPEVLERIFEPFFTTKKFGEGSGLGLSMVYGFVRQSGGHIAVESTVGGGSTVRLYMPRAGAKAEADEAHAKRGNEKKAPGHEVILVVEDDGRVRKTATSILRKQGYEVVEANDAGEALQAVDRLPRLDLLFTDVVLANGMNGRELAHQVLCRRPQTRILLTSGYARQLPAAESLLGDGIGLLRKPYRRSELTARVRELLDRSA
jgi:two-component system cell cycle sensor histidine kinase/response regulator CckA